MAVLTAALNTPFTPSVGEFIVQSSGVVDLQRKNNSGASFVTVETLYPGAKNVSNPIAGAIYQLVPIITGAAPTVSADQ